MKLIIVLAKRFFAQFSREKADFRGLPKPGSPVGMKLGETYGPGDYFTDANQSRTFAAFSVRWKCHRGKKGRLGKDVATGT